MEHNIVESECTKVGYSSRKDVKRAAKNHQRNNLKTIYKCSMCGLWHGSSLTKADLKLRKKALRDNLKLKGKDYGRLL